MKDEIVRQLIEKYLNNTLSDGERRQLLHLTEEANNAYLLKLLDGMLAKDPTPTHAVDEERLRKSLAKVLEVDKQEATYIRGPRMRILPTTWLRYAAAVILIAGLGAYIWINNLHPHRPSAENTITSLPVNDIIPGGQKAVLTLADGTAIPLDSAANGQLATQQGSQILKKEGQIIYTPVNQGQGSMAYNTLRTPRGGTYQLSLPDGTKVWLNAASSISYPVAFAGKERVVEMTGEAYFEVAPHAQMPFRVKINETNSIEVLGTQFNVKAYTDDERISTTLLQGAVRVASNGKKITLKPGEQAQASVQQLSVKTLGQTGMSEAMAWKEGRFNFQ
ncbi:MAG: FecR domain-containing protein, partial [Chitinophaga rupis]